VGTIDAADVDVLRTDVGTSLGARADYVGDERCKDSVGPAADVFEGDVGNVEACLFKCISDTIQSVADSVIIKWHSQDA